MLPWRSYLRHVDYILLLVAAGLIVYGCTMIYFATRHDLASKPTYYLQQQILFAVVGVVAMIAVSALDYEVYRRWQWALYAFAVFTIAAVYVLGPITRGSRRWIPLGPLPAFQPSQLAVFILVVALAAFLVDRMDLLGTWRLTGYALLYVAVPGVLVFFQPDFGTSMVLVALTLALLFFFGTPWTHFAVIGAAAVGSVALVFWALPAVGLHVIKTYQANRLLVFLDPTRDPLHAGYNVIQSMIAVGSGGFTGRGNMATQTTLDFLPEHHTDFIFAVVSERNGFVGAAILVALYALFVWRALRIAALSRDTYGSVMAGGIAVVFLFEIFVNIGMTIGIMPVTGIPLPFVSYGGAAMITFLMLVGLLEAIHIRSSVSPGPGGRFAR